MAISRGIILGPYEVLSRIGVGGMGEVWRARDQRIGRDVAVKVLPEAYAPGDDRVRRFEQEARAAGALSHPGLVTIFDVGTYEGAPYIVMELLEGETLRGIIGETTPSPLPLKKAVEYAIQIAAALAEAHDKAIIHRDLKPENIFITSEGRLKILDFGLAKLAEEAGEREDTRARLTTAGLVVGTPGYMSPEQVSAKPVDSRTDLFALGAVLYEMCCGKQAFERETAVETMSAILNDEPEPLASLLPNISPALDAVIQHCLEKSPRDRFQSARDLAFELRIVPEFQTGRHDRIATAPVRKVLPRQALIAGAVVLALAAAGFSYLHARSTNDAGTGRRTFQQLTFGEALSSDPTLSPDGKTFAYVSAQSGNRDIYVQRVDGRAATDITADSPDDDSEPAFSPDGSQIAFRSERDGGGIFVMGVTGESVRRLTDFGYNPSWSNDGTQLVIATHRIEMSPHIRTGFSELWIVDARTGARRPLIQPGKGGPDFGVFCDAVQPSWSPHGKRIAFWGISTWSGQRDIRTIDPRAPRPKETIVQVTNDPSLNWNPVWSPDGRYLYYGSNRDETLNLWRIRVDEASGRPLGAPEPLSLPAPISGNFTFSQQGDLAYTTVNRSFRLLAFPFDAARGALGPPRPLFGGSQEIISFELSPDQQSIAFTARSNNGRENVFIANVDGSRRRQVTSDAVRDRTVTWSPDGKRLYFYSNRDGGERLWSVQADGSRLGRVVDDADLRPYGAIYWASPSPDAKTLAAETDNGEVLVHLDRPAGQQLELFHKGLEALKWSPDGTRLVGEESGGTPNGRRGIVLYSLLTRQTERIAGRGATPQWLPDGKRIVFFEKQGIDMLDLATRRVTKVPVAPPPGVELTDVACPPHVSRDGSLVIARQSLEQGDVWMVHFGKE